MNTRSRLIRVDGQWIPGAYLGKGLFTTAYRYGDTVYLLTNEDYSKEAIALFADQSLTHVPKIRRHEDWKHYQVYSMPFYQRLTKKDHPKAYVQYESLNTWGVAGAFSCYAWLSGHTGLSDTLKAALQSLLDAFSNYESDNLCLEFNKVNLGVDSNGDLVLRDVLFSRGAVREKLSGKKRKRAVVCLKPSTGGILL